MAALQQAIDRILQDTHNSHQRAAQKQRLVADPLVTVDELARAFGMCLLHYKTKDMWGLLMPPAEGPNTFSFKTRASTCLPWLAKTSGIMYDIVSLAKNTKVSSAKVIMALQHLHRERHLINPTGKPDAALFDQIDITIRILLAMWRSIKTDKDTYSRIMRQASSADQVKIKLILSKIELPSAFQPDPAEQSPGVISKDFASDSKDAKPTPPSSKPNGTPKGTPPPPSSWGKWPPTPDSQSPAAAGHSAGLMEEIVAYVPPEAVPKAQAKKSKKQPVPKNKPVPKNDAKKAKMSTKAVKAKAATPMKAMKKVAKKPAKGIIKVNENKGRPDNFTFTSTVYGCCKAEFYTNKSYITYLDAENKSRLIIACNGKMHWAIVAEIYPMVKDGKPLDEIKAWREELMGAAKDM